MKISKCLIFKVDKQKYAIKTKNVINVIENVKLIHHSVGETISRAMFNFKGISIPLLSLHDINGTARYLPKVADCILIAEVNFDGMRKIIGIDIDEIIEVSEIDDFMSYQFIQQNVKKANDFREAIVMHNNEPVIVLNTNKLWLKQMNHNEFQRIEVSIN
jgi:chemotaxis signal transduction protein